MTDVDAVSEGLDAYDYIMNDGKTVGVANINDKIENQISEILQNFNKNIEELYCMGRCSVRRELEMDVSVKRDKEGKASGSIDLEASSEDKKDSFYSHFEVDDKGNVSGEIRYKYKLGPTNSDKD